MTAVAVSGRSYALLADGTTIEIRPANPADLEAVQRFHEAMSPENLYLRFFDLRDRAGEQEARRVCRPASPGHAALLALLGERVVGVASYETGSRPAVAEIAFAAADDMHGRGIATLLLEHLVSIGRARQVQSFAALILAENTAMLRVFAVYAGRTEEGQRAAASHTAAVATPLVSREALCQQAGIVATESFGELLAAAALLATQPVPAGPRVAVVSNVGGAGVLAADACVESGLTVHQPSAEVHQRLGKIIPLGGALRGTVPG